MDKTNSVNQGCQNSDKTVLDSSMNNQKRQNIENTICQNSDTMSGQNIDTFDNLEEFEEDRKKNRKAYKRLRN